ncbi:MAG: hypothetical protein JSS36_01115 [Proteobacteria bacterium]|nr:hypothetical protein [Pseudomonadota bacterium]
MSRMKRCLRRVPFVRWAALLHAQQLRSERAKIRQDYVLSVLATVGNVTITWAGIERMLDELIAWYQQNCIEIRKDHPISLSGKLDYLKIMEKDDRLTEGAVDFIRDLRIKTKILGEKRHAIIHSLLSHNGGYSLKWTAQRVKYEGPHAKLEIHTYHNDDLQKISSEISDHSNHIAPRIWVLVGHDPKKFPEQKIAAALKEFGFENGGLVDLESV